MRYRVAEDVLIKLNNGMNKVGLRNVVVAHLKRHKLQNTAFCEVYFDHNSYLIASTDKGAIKLSGARLECSEVYERGGAGYSASRNYPEGHFD